MSIEVTALFENRVHDLGLQSIGLQKTENAPVEKLPGLMKEANKRLPQEKDSDCDPGSEK